VTDIYYFVLLHQRRCQPQMIWSMATQMCSVAGAYIMIATKNDGRKPSSCMAVIVMVFGRHLCGRRGTPMAA